MIHLEVAVAAPLQFTLTYSLPSPLFLANHSDNLFSYIGRRVLVPLGRRKVTGYVLNAAPAVALSEFKVRDIASFLDNYPLFHSDFVPFLRWIAGYYHYPLGLVVKAALPGGLAPKSIKNIVVTGETSALLKRFDGNIPSWASELAEKKRLGGSQTKALLSDKTKAKIVSKLEEEKILECVDVTEKDRVREKKEVCYTPLLDGSRCYPLPPDTDTATAEVFTTYQNVVLETTGHKLKLSEAKALFFLQQLAGKNNCAKVALKDLRKSYKGVAKPILGLMELGLVSQSNERVYRSPFGGQLRFYPRPETLTKQQEEVLGKIVPVIKSAQYQPFLLHGITGCGKTEVYLRAAEETLAIGRDVIVLVPEIALATQLEAHLLSRFGDKVVLLHSGMSGAEKYDQYFLALSGKAKIVIGARSAIFAPLKDPGLIIVDEEHDSSYKQDDSFCYHGRDLAVVRARHHKSVVILGSATPSVTSYANGKNGKYSLLTMDKRVGESYLPKVTLVDLNDKEKSGKRPIIRKKLLDKLSENVKAGKQSILLLNRRGFSTALLCKDCGTPVQCNHCNVSLTLHKEKNRLICHYCGFTQNSRVVCLECRSTDLVPAGFGTERVEEELGQLLPEAKIQRLDSDTAADRRRFMNVLADMHDRKIDILIGTQMIAKGHHFPHVTLVGVVWADGGMSMPDYKAAERSFQLITQVTGRAGRGEFPGEVIIQTLRPEHYAIQFAKKHEYLMFYDHEIQLRQRPLFPPFVRLVVLRIKGPVEKLVQQNSVAIAKFCRNFVRGNKKQLEVLGPAPAPLDKVKDNFRWQILVKGAVVSDVQELCSALTENKAELVASKCGLTIDVDPENMM